MEGGTPIESPVKSICSDEALPMLGRDERESRLGGKEQREGEDRG